MTAASSGEGWAATNIDDLGSGPGFRKIRGAIGVTAFGINAIVLPPGIETGRHFHDRQQEVYFVHRGTAHVMLDGEPVTAPEGSVVVIEPETSRKFEAGSSPTTLLVIGGAPGKAYEVGPWEQ